MDQLVSAAASSGDQGYGPVIIQTTEGPCVLIAPESFPGNGPPAENDDNQVPVYYITQPEECNSVTDSQNPEKENESTLSEHSYTKSSEEDQTEHHHLPLSLGSTSYVIANRSIPSGSQFSDTFRICDGSLQTIHSNKGAVTKASSDPKPTLKLIKREPETPTKSWHSQNVSSVEASLESSVVRPQPKSPKKIVRLYNPSDGGHKTFVITTNGQSKKQTFVTNGSSKRNFPLKSTATLVHLNEKGDTVVKPPKTSSSTELPAACENLQRTATESAVLNREKTAGRPVLLSEADVKVEPLSPPASPAKLPAHKTVEHGQLSLPQYQNATVGVEHHEVVPGVYSSRPCRTNSNLPAALGSPPDGPTTNSQESNDVSCHSLSETLINAASSSSTAPSKTPSLSTAVTFTTSQTLPVTSTSLSTGQISCPPPVIRRFILTSSSSSSTIQSPSTASTASGQMKTFSLQAEGTHPIAVEHDSQSSGFDPGPRDDSLTNIQWLRKMSGQNLAVTQKVAKRPTQGAANSATTSVQIIATEQQIEQIGRECGTKKRPPYSYMHLIQMAISSKADKRMTLREIYKWIEDKFPYYRFSTKQGWKNSIRHNLSLYNIFVREKPYTPGRTGSSYWTLRSDLMDKGAKNIHYTTLNSIDKGGSNNPYVHVIGKTGSGSRIFKVRSGSSGKSELTIPTTVKPRKGPAPLLPKLPPPAPMQSPLQTFAIIPLPAGMSVVPPHPVVMSPWPVASPATAQGHLTAPSISFQNLSAANLNTSGNLKRTCNPESDVEPYRKHVKIAPKASILDKSSVRRVRADSGTASLDTSDLRKQLSNIHVDSGIASDMSSCDSPISTELPSRDTNVPIRGLPRPTIFRHKRSRKDKVVVLRDCDEEISMSVGTVSNKDSMKENRPISGQRKSSVRLVDIKSPGEVQDMHFSLNESAFSENGFNDLLASIEKDFSSPMKGLLVTPPKPDDNKRAAASTPFGNTPLSPSWISPIKNVTPLSEDIRQMDSGFFTPDSKLTTSTPNGEAAKSRTSRRTGLRTSPRIGSLRDLGLPGLTPLKASSKAPTSSEDPGGQGDDDSPNTSLISNQSFQKLLGDLNLDSMMDDGVVDLGNLSFLQC